MRAHRPCYAAALLTAPVAFAQTVLNAHSPPGTGDLLEPAAMFFDLRAFSNGVVVEGLTTAVSTNPGQLFHFELLIRDGTGLGGTRTTGPGSTLDGWTSLGTVEGIGTSYGGVSLPVSLPRFRVPPGRTVGVCLYFHHDWGPFRFGNFPGPYLTYEDNSLRLTTGDARAIPFYAGQYYAPYSALVGSIIYEVSPCYVNCDSSTLAPVLNVGDFICFQQRFAAGDTWANCDGSTAEPALNVADFVCFLQQFAAGCS